MATKTLAPSRVPQVVNSKTGELKQTATAPGPVVQPNKGQRAKNFKSENPKPDLHVGKRSKGGKVAIPEEVKGAKKERKSTIAAKSPSELKAEVNELLKDLRDSTDSEEKKRIRRALRARGHRGGLGEAKKGAKAE